MKCVIIEDQAPAQRILKTYIEDVETLELVGTFSNAIAALDYIKQHAVDLIFLDIHLPKISGIDFLKSLQNPPKVILTTAFSEYGVQSYELDVVDYLLKPFSFERFVKAIAKVNIEGRNEGASAKETIFIKSGYEYIKIQSKDILFIHSDMDYTEVHIPEKKLLSPETLTYWEGKLHKTFFRIHRSYLVNTQHIQKVVGNQVYLSNGKQLPIGRAYKERFLSEYVK